MWNGRSYQEVPLPLPVPHPWLVERSKLSPSQPTFACFQLALNRSLEVNPPLVPSLCQYPDLTERLARLVERNASTLALYGPGDTPEYLAAVPQGLLAPGVYLVAREDSWRRELWCSPRLLG